MSYVAIAMHASPYLGAYRWLEGGGYGTRYSNPGSLPPEQQDGVRFSKDGTIIFAAGGGTTRPLEAYHWSDAGWGTRYSDPAATAASTCYDLAIRTIGGVTKSVAGVNYAFDKREMAVVRWDSNATGWGSRYSWPGTIPSTRASGTSVDFTNEDSSDRSLLAYGRSYDDEPTFNVYYWTDANGFGSRFTKPPATVENKAQCETLRFSPGGGTIFGDFGGYLHAYPVLTGEFGTKHAAAAGDPSGVDSAYVSIERQNVFMSASSASPYVNAWHWSNNTGFGSKYSNPASSVGAQAWAITTARDGQDVLVGGTFGTGHNGNANFISGYRWTEAGGWGSRYSDGDSTNPQGAIYQIDYWQAEDPPSPGDVAIVQPTLALDEGSVRSNTIIVGPPEFHSGESTGIEIPGPIDQPIGSVGPFDVLGAEDLVEATVLTVPSVPTPGSATKTPLGGFFLDDVQLSTLSTTPILCCRSPQDGATDVDADATIALTVLDVSANGLNGDAKIWVTTNSVRTLVYDQALAQVAADWTVDTDTMGQSIDSIVDDINEIVLSHTTAFISEETVTVEITATNVDTDALSETYTFGIEDTTAPSLESVAPFGLRKIRVEFTEAMDNTAGAIGSALCVVNISGRVAFFSLDVTTAKSNVIEAPVTSFTSAHVGLFVGVARAQNSQNNGTHEILEIISSTKVRVESTLVDEEPADPRTETVPQVRLSCYRLRHVVPASGIEPAFEPIVLSATNADSSTIVPGEDVRKYADLLLQDDLTPQVDYNLDALKIVDLAGNEIGSTLQFTSWSLTNTPNRQFNVWDNMIPQTNKNEDVSQDLRRFIECINEVMQQNLFDVDQFGHLMDPDNTKDNVLDTMLEHLGNPLAFVRSLSVQKKRELAPLLVPMYKQKGTSKGIIDIVLFFLGPNVTQVEVNPFWMPSTSWVLGESMLGTETTLAPPATFLRYAFEVDVTTTTSLTSDEIAIVNDIVEFVKPAHTHFVRLLENSSAVWGNPDYT